MTIFGFLPCYVLLL